MKIFRLQNRVVQYPIVVQEWNKEVTIDTNNLDVETIKQLMVNDFMIIMENVFLFV